MFNHPLAFVHPRRWVDNPARGFKAVGSLAENIEITGRFHDDVAKLTAGCLSVVEYWSS